MGKTSSSNPVLPDVTKRILTISQFVIVYCLLFNSTVFLYHSNLTKTCFGCEHVFAQSGIYWYAGTIFLMLFWVFALFFILSFSRVLFCCVVPLIFFTSALVTYAEYIQKTPVNDNIISAAFDTFQTGTEELQNFLGWPLITWLIFALILSVLFITRYLRRISASPEIGMLGILPIIVFFWYIANSIIYFIGISNNPSQWDFHPYDYINITARYLILKARTEHLHQNKFDVATLPASWTKDFQHPLYVIVIIGEAVRADHLNLNGYALHKTTPLLGKEANLINYSNVSACGTLTSVSVPCLMTRATRKNLAPATTETSFISIFRALGFKTFWVSEQTRFLNYTSPVTSIAKEAEQEIFEDNSYTKKAQKISNHFDSIIRDSTGDMLAVFHMIGSHWFYEYRYPTGFRHYTPVCMDTFPNFCSTDALINSYDNTLIYMDYFLTHTINLLKDKNAILVYVSDHGEYLGEKGRYMHGQDTEDPELRHVPMIWWVSDTFKRLHPDAVARMLEKKNIPLSHDYVFHSVLDCAGVTSGAIDKKLSLCR